MSHTHSFPQKNAPNQGGQRILRLCQAILQLRHLMLQEPAAVLHGILPLAILELSMVPCIMIVVISGD